MNETTERIMEKLRALVREGNVRRIKVTKDGELLLNIPLTVGAGAGLLGLMSAPLLTVAGVVATIGRVPEESVPYLKAAFAKRKPRLVWDEAEGTTD